MSVSCLLDVLICNSFRTFSCQILNRHLVIVFKMHMVYANSLWWRTTGVLPQNHKYTVLFSIYTLSNSTVCSTVWGIFSWHSLGPLVPIEHRLNTTVYLSIVADHVHPFMTTVYHLLMYFQQDNAACHKDQIISDWFLEHDNEFTLLKCPPQSPDLNPIEHLWDVEEREIHIMDVQTTNLQQLCDAIMTIWPTSLRNVSNTLLNLCHEELRQFWKKGVQPGTSKCT